MPVKNLIDVPLDEMDGAHKTFIQWLISPIDGEERIGLRRFIIKSNGYIPAHRHKELYHIQFVLKGKYIVGIGEDGRLYRLGIGSPTYGMHPPIAVATRHFWWSPVLEGCIYPI